MHENVKKLSDIEFEAGVLKSETPAVVDFSATWCGPCKTLTPLVDQIAGEFRGRVNFFMMDVEECAQTAQQYRIRSVPTLLFFKGGKVMEQIIGLVPAAKIKAGAEKIS
ncbi:MAG: thioredoxin [Myxococcota bacterium]